MISFADRFWLAWKVLTGRMIGYRADSQTFRVTLDFTAAERMSLSQRLKAEEARRKQLRGKTTSSP